ncbi:hypothetical protein THAOC_29644 [Thalassiosira oceanica]|uniref:Uncharacterized protein n=1 Tax=Thalassiosira oceanica TaxID=159749 RepID=K0RDF1_THAOC|nr:hypothetical protein THAOC_29644 [Thalassiosira oceanica]|eukprot:EJK51205.1 hypothetical protein THAOC_29644 [Thalassiosira oceanica]
MRQVTYNEDFDFCGDALTSILRLCTSLPDRHASVWGTAGETASRLVHYLKNAETQTDDLETSNVGTQTERLIEVSAPAWVGTAPAQYPATGGYAPRFKVGIPSAQFPVTRTPAPSSAHSSRLPAATPLSSTPRAQGHIRDPDREHCCCRDDFRTRRTFFMLVSKLLKRR